MPIDHIELFELQDEIATAMATALRVALAAQEEAPVRHTPSIPAYEALLTARHLHWQVRGESMARASEYYERAIALDPQYPLAHALYADYLFGRTTVGMSPMREVAPRIRAAALRALELDAQLSDAHSPLALVAATHDYDWDEAARQFAYATWFARAIEERYSMVGALLHSAICRPLRNSAHWPPWLAL